MKIIIIAAMTKNRVIGLDNKLPWRIKEELQYFRKITLNKAIIMGGNTFVSLKQQPLSNRYNIVLTRKTSKFIEIIDHQNENHQYNNLAFATNVQDGLTKAKEFYLNNKLIMDQQEILIIGGREIYLQFLPLADQLYLSIIKHNYYGNVFFPEFDVNQWKLISNEEHQEFVAQIFSAPRGAPRLIAESAIRKMLTEHILY